ncbi:DUF1109 family protein [Fertoebacter nigrum]|uniref:DUF1109 family protein n=1 Tax=Fertoeibacter niger TaxID=2656921 RepID=A0A8X8KQ42_9RHOB|nr:NrsF family protein [Fertoeibacter niger]NUB45795.1 DUF1109 family protein [Fertoeibacter niger]
MTTEALIATLAADAPTGPGLRLRLWRWLLPGLPVAGLAMIGALALSLGLRDGLWAVLASPVLGKALLPLAIAAAALLAALRLSRPLAPAPGSTLPALLALLVVALLAVTLAQTPPSGWLAAATGPSIPVCLLTIPLLALLPMAVLLAALRQGASLDPARTGRMAGLAAGGLAAAVYALHCPEDSPLFFVIWYGLGVVIAGEIGRRAGARALRW